MATKRTKSGYTFTYNPDNMTTIEQAKVKGKEYKELKDRFLNKFRDDFNNKQVSLFTKTLIDLFPDYRDGKLEFDRVSLNRLKANEVVDYFKEVKDSIVALKVQNNSYEQ